MPGSTTCILCPEFPPTCRVGEAEEGRTSLQPQDSVRVMKYFKHSPSFSGCWLLQLLCPMLFLCTRERRTEAYFLFSTYCCSVFFTISCPQAGQLLLFLSCPFPDRCLRWFSANFLKIIMNFLLNKEPHTSFYSLTYPTCPLWVNPAYKCLYLKATNDLRQ